MRRMLLAVPIIILVTNDRCALPGGTAAKQEGAQLARMQDIAERFVAEWSNLHKVEKKLLCHYRDRRFNRVWTGWYVSFDIEGLEGWLSVSEGQQAVVHFRSLGDRFEIPQYKGGKALTREESLENVKSRTKVPLDAAKEHAQRFLARVYPRYEQRSFRPTKGELEVSNYTAFYRICWKEVLDEDAPRAFPNEIEVRVNPETGVIEQYTAENYSLPEGFKLALKEKEAVGRTRDSIRDMLSNPRLKLSRGPTVLLKYSTAEHKAQKDRIFWVVLYSFEDLDKPDTFQGGFRRRRVTRVFDAASGERDLDEERRLSGR